MLAMAPAMARQDVPLTLAEAEDLALRAEPGQQSMQARAAALEERAIAAGELPDPMLRVGLNNFPVESGGFSTEGMTSLGVGLRQSFPSGKTLALSERRLEEMAAEMHQGAAARGRSVLNATRTAWYDLYYWRQAEALVAASRPFFNELAAISRSLYSVGRKSQQDVLRAELELSRLDDRLIEIHRQQARARAVLGEWIGADAARPLPPQLPSLDAPPALETLHEALLRHPRLQAADARIEVSSTGVALAEQRGKPAWALDLGYSYREGYLPSGEPRSDMVTLGVTVGLPFFSSRSVDSTLSAALQERSAARAGREQTLREMRRVLEAEHARWQELSRRLALYDGRILDLARAHAEASLLAYQSDRGDFAEVMRGYITDLNTRIEYVRLQVERAQSHAALAELGGIE
jgi:outer membrane protein TolC